MPALTIPRIIISGISENSSAEKVALGLVYILQNKGFNVSCCIIGSDFQLATVLSRAINRYVRLLDPRLLSFEQILSETYLSSLGADFLLIISPQGLYTSIKSDNFILTPAEIAVRTDTPVILTGEIDSLRSGIVPTVKGFKDFAQGLKILGYIGISGNKNIQKICDVPSLFAEFNPLPLVSILDLEIVNLLALPLGVSHKRNETSIDRKDLLILIKHLELKVNLEILIQISKKVKSIEITEFTANPLQRRTRIAVAEDLCFSLGYQNNLELLQYFGAEIVPFSIMTDQKLPKNISAIYLRGAFLNDYFIDLKDRLEIKSEVIEFAKKGGVIFSEGSATAFLCKDYGDNIDIPITQGLGLINASAKYSEKEEFYGEGLTEQISVIGDLDLPISFFNKNDWHLVRPEKMTRVLKISDFERNSFFDGYSPSAQIFASFSYLNFASNPQIALNLVDAAEVGVKN